MSVSLNAAQLHYVWMQRALCGSGYVLRAKAAYEMQRLIVADEHFCAGLRALMAMPEPDYTPQVWYTVYEVRKQGAIGIWSKAHLRLCALSQSDALEQSRATWNVLGYETCSPVSADRVWPDSSAKAQKVSP